MRKLRKAVTDAGTTGEIGPGAKNLITILDVINPDLAAKFTEDGKSGEIRYGDLKSQLAENLADYLAPFRAKRQELASRPDDVWAILEHGTEEARKIASATLREAKDRMGFV
jgi:tryptophanyl-tRNA synthetase